MIRGKRGSFLSREGRVIVMTNWWLQATQRLRALIGRNREDEKGQGLVEYALILALIAILVIIALQFLQPAISNTLNTVSNSL